MKKIIMVVAMILCLGITVHASAMPVTLPYVPPMEVQVYDSLFNASGVTAPNETDEEKRLDAYIDLFTRVLGNGAQSFFDGIGEVVENAKQTRQIKINSDLAEQLAQGVKVAINTGVHTGGEVNNITRDNIQEMATEIFGYYLQESLVTQIITEWSVTPEYYMAMYKVSGQDMLVISSNITVDSSKIYFAGPWRRINNVNSIMTSASWFRYSADGWQYYDTYDLIKGVQVGNVQILKTKDSATQSAINSGKNAILTADSTLTESNLLDTTKPVVINIYRNITYPATTQEDIEEKQRELVVTNIATDEVAITQKETLEDIRTETYGDTETYKLDLLPFYPFCIPRDIMLLLQAFVAEPQTPEFDIPFPTWENGQMTTMNYTLSLAQFESLAVALRLFEIVAFTIGLLVVTRQKYLRG